MVTDPNAVPSVEALKAALLERQALAEQSRLQAEYNARVAQATAARNAAQSEAEARAVAGLRELRPLYQRRAQLTRDLAPLLAELYQLDAQVKARLDELIPPALIRFAAGDYVSAGQLADSLRQRAGVAGHSFIGIECPADDDGLALAVTVSMGLAGSMIGPRWLRIGTKSTSFNF